MEVPLTYLLSVTDRQEWEVFSLTSEKERVILIE